MLGSSNWDGRLELRQATLAPGFCVMWGVDVCMQGVREKNKINKYSCKTLAVFPGATNRRQWLSWDVPGVRISEIQGGKSMDVNSCALISSYCCLFRTELKKQGGMFVRMSMLSGLANEFQSICPWSSLHGTSIIHSHLATLKLLPLSSSALPHALLLLGLHALPTISVPAARAKIKSALPCPLLVQDWADHH